jgi:hypothetical protein
MNIDTGHWKLSDGIVEIPKTSIGFVYIITRISPASKFYIGKKLLEFKHSRKPLKNRKNKRHYKTESDWKTYCGSSNELLADIEKYGKENFTFEIIHWCDNKWMMSYLELKEQNNLGLLGRIRKVFKP